MRRVSCRLLLFRSCLVRKIHSEREQNSEEKKKTEHNFARIHKLHNGRSVGFEKLLFFVVCEEELPMATNAMHTHTHTQTHHFRVEGTGQTKHLIYIFDLVEIKNTHHTQTHIRSAAVEMKTNATHATRSFVLIKKRAHSQNNILHDIRESMSDEYHLETTKTKGKPKKKKIEMQYVLICGSKRR